MIKVSLSWVIVGLAGVKKSQTRLKVCLAREEVAQSRSN